MISFFILPIIIAAHILILYYGFAWLETLAAFFKKKAVKIVIVILYAFGVLSLYLAYFARNIESVRFLQRLGSLSYGVEFYLFLIVLPAILISLIVRLIKRKKTRDPQMRRRALRAHGIVCVLLVAVICIWGVHNANVVRTTEYETEIDCKGAEPGDMKIALVADLHLGYNIGADQMRQMVDRVNRGDPDLIVVAGDVFDNDYDAIKDPDKIISILKEMKSRYGVYVVYGNHDVDERILGGFTFDYDETDKYSDPRMDEFIEKCGWTHLVDEGLVIADRFYLYGRPDYERLNRGVTQRKSAQEIAAVAKKAGAGDLPLIVIDHEPREYDELDAAGVALDLSGHTHDGQFFPLNLSSRYLTWENSAGLITHGKMKALVTSGVGLYGPDMRVGTIAEVCQLTVHFK